MKTLHTDKIIKDKSLSEKYFFVNIPSRCSNENEYDLSNLFSIVLPQIVFPLIQKLIEKIQDKLYIK